MRDSAGKRLAIINAKIARTTRSSTSVKPANSAIPRNGQRREPAAAAGEEEEIESGVGKAVMMESPNVAACVGFLRASVVFEQAS
jgi:hypothetical protein